MKVLLIVAFVIVIIGCSTEQKRPVDVQFRSETLKRLGGRGDNWCITWAKDDSQITSLCDGNWLNNPEGGWRNHLFRIVGEADTFQREDISNYPNLSDTISYFGYGVVSVDGNIYSAASKTPGLAWSGPFLGVKLLKSPDNGQTWYRVDRNGNELQLEVNDSMRNIVNDAEMFSLEEYGLPHNEQMAYPFSYFDFVQCGKDNSAAKDEYIYIYAPEGALAHKLTMARVHKDSIGVRSKWQYFTNYNANNQPQWTGNIEERGYAYEFPQKNTKDQYFGWYSWLPSVVWNEGLGLYIMVNGGTYAGRTLTNSDEDYYCNDMHEESGSLGFWYSEKPYGPWEQFYYTEYWITDENNLNYQPKLSPKWISEDGTKMTLIWSDAKEDENGDTHSINYLWNQMEISIVLDK